MQASVTQRTPIKYSHEFCPDGVNPFDTVSWKKFNAEIKDDEGKLVYVQEGTDFPDFFRQHDVNIVASKYFYGPRENRESSLKQMLTRVCGTIAKWAYIQGYFGPTTYELNCSIDYLRQNPQLDEREGENDFSMEEQEAWNSYWAYRDDLTWLCLHQHMAFNSPVWFNVGTSNFGSPTNDNWALNHVVLSKRQDLPLEERLDGSFEQIDTYNRPQCSACFIQSVKDDLRDIMQLATSEAMLFKYGSGTGTDLSTLRSSYEYLSSGGKASGPLSFMRIYDQGAGVIKSGGKTRRAAKMQSLKVWHPDIEKFITCKRDEEVRGRILKQAGYAKNMDQMSEQLFFQNANLSVRINKQFLKAVDNKADFHLVSPKDGKTVKTVKAHELWDLIAQCAWECADPGIQYDTEINRMNPFKSIMLINASNPCSEYMFLDDTACNLASHNLCAYADNRGRFSSKRFRKGCRVTLIAQDAIVDAASYPNKKIAINSHKYRTLGMGYANLGALLMKKGVAYDSEAGRTVAGCITSIMHEESYRTSAEMAASMGAYYDWQATKADYLDILKEYRDNANRLRWENEFEEENKWQDIPAIALLCGLRNAQTTLLAPTGTISFLMGCDTTGVEPGLGLVTYKNLAGGGKMKLINDSVATALDNLGYDEPSQKKILRYIQEEDTIQGCKELKPEHLPVFDCALAPQLKNGQFGRCVSPEGHVDMVAAAQEFLSGAVSKTVNVPNSYTKEDIKRIYRRGADKKVKAMALYRDGCKAIQAVETKGQVTDRNAAPVPAVAQRRYVPPTANCIRHVFEIDGHKGYFFITPYEDGSVGEIFIKMAKEGTVISGLMDSLGIAWSLLFQHGVPFETMYNLYRGMNFNPSGWVNSRPGDTSKTPKVAKSIVDYIFRWIALNIYKIEDDLVLHNETKSISVDDVFQTPKNGNHTTSRKQGDACPGCGSSNLKPDGKCMLCCDCGHSNGCSG